MTAIASDLRVARWVVRRHLRRRWLSLLPFLCVVSAGTSVALLATNAAYQTDTAYHRYLDRSAVGDLLINPSIQTTEIDDVIRGLPGVTSVVTEDLLYAALGEYSSAEQATAEAGDELVTGSLDGRYVTRDRLAYRAGRAPSGTDEAVVSVELADLNGIEIGDRLPLTFGSVQDDVRAIYLGEGATVGLLGVEDPTVVGIATFPDQVLPDGLFARGRVVVSPDIVARYSCMPSELPQDATVDDVIEELAPAQCATSYRYWSLRVEGGESGTQAALDAFGTSIAERNAALAPVMSELGIQYFPIVTTTADEVARVERTTRPTVVALMTIGIAAALLSLVVACMVLSRTLRRDDEFYARLNELGMPARQRAEVIGGPATVAAILGALSGVVIVWLVPTGPVGVVDVLEPARTGLHGWAWWMAAVMFAVSVVSAVGISAWVVAFAGHSAPRYKRTKPRFAVWPGRPDVSIGIAEVIVPQRSTMLGLAASTIACAASVAALVFGAGLTHLVSTPAAFGWPWDLANLIGSGYGGVTVDTAAEDLDSEPRIEHWSALGMIQGVSVEDATTPALILYGGPADGGLVLSEGRLPSEVDEVALGSRSAAERSIEVGDEVSIEGEGLRLDRATVTGTVVLPAIGPLQADRVTPGRGVLFPDDAFDAETVAMSLAFVGINVVDGTDVDRLRLDLDDEFRSWEMFGLPRPLAAPVRPPEIVNVGAIRRIPLLVGGLVGAVAVIGFAWGMLLSARARRHDLAVLRTLGFTNRQLRRSLRVQSVVTAVLTSTLGTVAGVIVGRACWRYFAAELGVVPDAQMPLGIPLAVMLAGAALGLVSAILPGSYASRLPVGATLRTG